MNALKSLIPFYIQSVPVPADKNKTRYAERKAQIENTKACITNMKVIVGTAMIRKGDSLYGTSSCVLMTEDP